MPNYLESLGQQMGGQVAGGLIGEGMGLLFQPLKNKQQLKQAGKLQKLQIQGNKEMGEFNLQKQMELWNATNYGAQIQHMKAAGLNPGLMYGMGGGGGATASAQPGNTGGQHAETAQATRANEGMGLQAALLGAQIENIKADTANKLGDAANKPKIGANLDASTANLSAGVENTKAQTQLTYMETEIKRIAASVSRQTINEQMRVWELEVNKMEEEIRQLRNGNKITEEQMPDIIKKMKFEAANEYLKGLNINASTNKLISEIANNQVVRQALIQDLWMDRDKLSIENAKLRLLQMGFNNENVELALPMIGGPLNIMKGDK